MPRITAIKPQKDENRVNIYLDGKFGFGLDLENYVKLHLKVEQELTQEEINEIVNKSEHQKILNRILTFVSIRPRSEEEIKVWLRRKKIPEDMHYSLKETLQRLGFINDTHFARWFVEQRLTFRPKGKQALKYELLKKGIDRKIIDETLEKLEIDEVGLALRLLKKRESKWKRIPEEEVKQKMYEYLARSGFSWETVKEAVDKFRESV